MGRMWMTVGLCALSATASAADWPQWLGPTRDAHVGETGLVAGWKQGTQVLWKQPMGRGYASVAVVQGVVYGVRSTDGTEELVAFDAVTGTPRWSFALGPYYEDVQDFDGPRVTPTVVGEQVIALHASGRLVSVNRADGTLQWSVDLQKDLRGVMPRFGYAGSPLVDDGRIYLSIGGDQGGSLVALSLKDGRKIWASGSYSAGYSSPIRAELAGRDVIVFFTGFGVVGADVADGTVRWSYAWKTDYEINAATPVVLGANRLFVASGYGVGGAALLIHDDGQVTELWRTKRMKNKLATSVLYEGHLYGFNETRLTSLDASTGEEDWSDGDYGRGALVLAEGHLLVVSENCTVSMVKATPKGHQVVGTPIRPLTGEPCWSAPAVSQGVLYLRDGAEMAAIEIKRFGPSPAAE